MPKVLLKEEGGYRIHFDPDMEEYSGGAYLLSENSGSEYTSYVTWKSATAALKRRIKLAQTKRDPIEIIAEGRTALATAFVPNHHVRISYSPKNPKDPAWKNLWVESSGLVKDTSENRVKILKIDELKQELKDLTASLDRISYDDIKKYFGFIKEDI